jgi:succinyl-CoA synthetase alpha subunit
MAILVNKRTRIVVHGMGDDAGRRDTAAGRGYAHGSRCFVAGVDPVLAGRQVDGIPVFGSVAEARAATGADACVVYAPPGRVPAAVEEAAEAGIPLVVCMSNGVPATELRPLRQRVERCGTRLLGPGCDGVVTPGQLRIGALPGDVHRRGRIGIVSRSVALTSFAARQMAPFGLGASTVVGLAPDQPAPSHLQLLRLFDDDWGTDAVLLIGAIHPDEEDECAAWIREHMRKPLVGFIDGADPAHAQGSRLQACGVHMAREADMLGGLVSSVVAPQWLPFD